MLVQGLCPIDFKQPTKDLQDDFFLKNISDWCLVLFQKLMFRCIITQFIMQYFPKWLKDLKNFNRGRTCFSGCKNFLLDQHLSTLPSTFWHCSIWVAISSFSNLCSTLFLLSMTFERFYSIIRPHKAVLLNTVKRAKITITCVLVFCVLFNVPHLFTTTQRGRNCHPIGKAVEYPHLQIYSWLTSVLNFFLPFLLLLMMNSVIIHTLRQQAKWSKTMSMSVVQNQGQGQTEGHSVKMRQTEKQVTVTLLLVTFTFLVLMTPSGSILIYVNVYDFSKSPQSLAAFRLLGSLAHKTYFTISGINFFLYVISGQKFRSDLVNLLTCKRRKLDSNSAPSADTTRNTALSKTSE